MQNTARACIPLLETWRVGPGSDHGRFTTRAERVDYLSVSEVLLPFFPASSICPRWSMVVRYGLRLDLRRIEPCVATATDGLRESFQQQTFPVMQYRWQQKF